MGRRSRSPFRPLSLRMILRADLMIPSRRWAVVSGFSVGFLRADLVTLLSFYPALSSPEGSRYDSFLDDDKTALSLQACNAIRAAEVTPTRDHPLFRRASFHAS